MKEIKIVAISDIHGELPDNLPSGDILTISGDICPVRGSHSPTSQMYWLKGHFLPWCSNLIKTENFKHIVFIAGNHDFVFKTVTYSTSGDFYMSLPDNVHYLYDSMVEVEGIKIYGTPWTPTFGNWAYMTCEEALDNIFSAIPENIDILLSHGPAFGWNDTIMQYNETENLGSKSLRKHILRAKPLWNFCGHIHSGSHVVTKLSHISENFETKSLTKIVNVSLLDEMYDLTYKPFQCIIIKD